MKKIFFGSLLVLSALSAQAQVMMTLGDRRYDVSTVDSIVFTTIELPSAATALAESGDYTIFAEALQRTGLADSMLVSEHERLYTMDRPTDRQGYQLYYPQIYNIGWTVFAEKDAVLRAAGINNFSDLVAKCKEWYGNPTWYNLIKEQNINVSTADDYTSEWNVVHMFVAYHLVRAKMAVDEIVYENNYKTIANWNYCFGYEPQAYFETMLPGTLLKVWQTNPKTSKELWVNRYVKNNTLTDQYATFGSDAIHPLVYSGAQIDRQGSIETLNAYVHSIDHVLVYDQNACDAQHERMRFHVNQLLPELMTNQFARATYREVSAWNRNGNGDRIAFPIDYFDHLHCYDPATILRYNVTGAWRALESTEMQGWGEKCDFAIRLPRVPSGKYEIRYMYAPMARGGEIEFYLGNDSTLSAMHQVNTLNATTDPMYGDMGYKQIDAYEGNYGIEAEKEMRQHGFMYAPASFSRGTYNTMTDKLTVTDDDPYAACKQMTGSTCCRTESGYGTVQLRYIVSTVDLKQSEDHWLRLKINPTEGFSANDLGWMMNFVELVPIDVANNDTLMEDWY